MEIFKLVGTIMVDNSEANKSIAKTEQQAKGLGESLSAGFKDVAAVGTAVAGAAAAIGTALFGLASDAADYGDNVAKSARRMKMTTDQYQELAYVAQRCGVNMSVMEKAAKSLEGTDLDFKTALDNIMSMDDITARREAAVQTFGENVAYQLENILQVSSEEYQSMQQQVHELGGVMSEEGTKQSEEFKDAVTDLDTAWQGLSNTIGLRVMPELTKLINWIANTAIPMMDKFVEDLDIHFEYGTTDHTGEAGGYYDEDGDYIPDRHYATGLPTVPYDGYRTSLHRGETVLNANDTRKLQEIIDGGGSDNPITIPIQIALDGKIIGEYSYQYARRKEKALGV